MPNLLVLDQNAKFIGFGPVLGGGKAAFDNPEEWQDLTTLFIGQQQPNLVTFEPILPDKFHQKGVT